MNKPPVRIAIAGAAGRMGTALIRCAQRMDSLRVTAAFEQANHPSLGKDAGAVAGGANIGVPLTDGFGALAHTDVLIDFTFHTATPVHVRYALQYGKPLVIGTTGLTEDESGEVRRAAAKLPIVWAPNMSLGINVLFSAVRKAAEVFGAAYRVEVDETHHIHKKDAPSGTALRLGEKVAEGLGRDFPSVMVHEPGETRREHPADRIVIRSHRQGEVVGDHTVSFENEGERIEFTHHVWSRDALAMGALRAAHWVKTRGPGLYDMQAVLGL